MQQIVVQLSDYMSLFGREGSYAIPFSVFVVVFNVLPCSSFGITLLSYSYEFSKVPSKISFNFTTTQLPYTCNISEMNCLTYESGSMQSLSLTADSALLRQILGLPSRRQNS